MPLEDYIAEHREAILGEQGSRYASFPILCKFIDAKQKLSIQVHPDDAYAKAAGMDNGKTELWYIVECDEDAYIYFGVNRDMTKEEFKRRIEENTVLEVLNKVPVHKGDYFLVEAGTIHAIGAGIIIYVSSRIQTVLSGSMTTTEGMRMEILESCTLRKRSKSAT